MVVFGEGNSEGNKARNFSLRIFLQYVSPS